MVQVHCTWRRLFWRGLEFHVCAINKSAHTKKKSGNLLKAPRIYIFIKLFLLFFCTWSHQIHTILTWCIWPIDSTQTGTTMPGQSGSENKGKLEQEPHHQMKFSVIHRTHPFSRYVFPLCRGYSQHILNPYKKIMKNRMPKIICKKITFWYTISPICKLQWFFIHFLWMQQFL